MVIELDRKSETPLYVQISNQLRDQIRSGELVTGAQLPPSGASRRCSGSTAPRS